MAKYEKYAEYKDSGVEWLGEIPKHWDAKRLGSFFEERREKVSDVDYPALSVTKNGIVPQLDTAAKTDAGDNRKLVKIEDFVINSRSDRKGSSGTSPYTGSVSLISIVMEPRRIYPAYAHHLLRGYPFQEEFYRYGKGIVADLWSTNSSEMKNILLPDMPMIEQKQIANFLDHETAKIDSLIAKQEKLIELLKEKRQAVINRTVTKGLNPDVNMKDSGIEWLGKIPDLWRVVNIQRVLNSIEQGSSPVAQNRAPQDDEHGVLKISAIKKGKFIASESKTLDFKSQLEEKYRVGKGDLLVTRANTPLLVADACVVKEEPKSPTMMCDLVYRLNTTSDVTNEFLCYWLLSNCGRTQIELDARGSSMTMAKVSQGHIKAWKVILPLIEEQKEIVCYLDKRLAKIDKLINKAKLVIEIIKERRTALISSAVTGKIDVRNWQNPSHNNNEANTELGV